MIRIEIDLWDVFKAMKTSSANILETEVAHMQVGDDGILRTRESIPLEKVYKVILHAIEPDTAHVPVRFGNIICQNWHHSMNHELP